MPVIEEVPGVEQLGGPGEQADPDVPLEAPRQDLEERHDVAVSIGLTRVELAIECLFEVPIEWLRDIIIN